MVDFLKANPYVTMDDYLWKLNPCLIKLMAMDNTRVHYLSEKAAKKKKGKVFDGSNLETITEEIDYESVDSRIEKMRSESKAYLDKALAFYTE